MSQLPSSDTQKQLTPVAIQTWLTTQIAEQLGVSPSEIDIQEPLDSYDLSSAQATCILAKSESILGVEVSPLLLWHYPTIASLSQRLAEEFEASDSEMFEL
ncbi:acyl carrier protein [Acaryochloris sp. IP29b_bin.137]|uniref:acyl carrier protein n=1 Tax=Acaryochloris sp. IP29b_bin.137 TaxID=2969217 RepID=UPI002602E710|nr:acyl carrier protein [Acaryochloris sp. IP29b_bin.137]